MNIIVDSLLTHFEKVGSGQNNLLFLHGWGSSSASFAGVVASLESSATCYVLDLPGHGATEDPPRIWDLDDYALFVKRFCEKVELTAVKAVIGHSNGGSIAIKIASQSLVPMDKLVLISAAGIRSQASTRKQALKVVAKAGKLATFPLPRRTKVALRRRLYSAASSDYLVMPQLGETFKRIVAEDMLDQSKSVKVPTLLLYGDKDTATPPTFGSQYKQSITGANLDIIEGGTHFMHEEEPSIIAARVKDFLKL